MITEGDISRAATVLELLMQQHAADPASAKTSELFDTFITLPGAYAVVKHAQAQNEGDSGLLAGLEASIMVSERSLQEQREELSAWARLALERRKESPAEIGGLLSSLKDACEADRIGRMVDILNKIVEIGAESDKPDEILCAMREFAKKEPALSGIMGMAMEKIRLANRINFAERLADMKKDFPRALRLRSPRHAKLVLSGPIPMPGKN